MLGRRAAVRRMTMPKKKSHNQTYHEGAQDERDAIRAHLRKLLGDALEAGSIADAKILNGFLAWIDERPIRYRARKGGLGEDARENAKTPIPISK